MLLKEKGGTKKKVLMLKSFLPPKHIVKGSTVYSEVGVVCSIYHIRCDE